MEKENCVGFMTGHGKLVTITSQQALAKAAAIRETAEAAVSADALLKRVLEKADEEEFDELSCSQAPQPDVATSATSTRSATKRPLTSLSAFKTPEVYKKKKQNGLSSFRSPRPAEPRPALLLVPDTPPAGRGEGGALVKTPLPASPLLQAVGDSFSSSPSSALSRVHITTPYLDKNTGRDLQDVVANANCGFKEEPPPPPPRGVGHLTARDLEDIALAEADSVLEEVPRGENLTTQDLQDIALATECDFGEDSFAEKEPVSGTDMFACSPDPSGGLTVKEPVTNCLTAAERADIEDISSVCFSSIFDEF